MQYKENHRKMLYEATNITYNDITIYNKLSVWLNYTPE